MVDRYEIRKASLSDIPAIHSLAWKIFPHTYKDILTEDQIRYMMDWMYSEDSLSRQMEEEGHTYLLLFDDDDMVGYVSYQRQGEDLYHLQKIYVLPERQGDHLGARLFQEAISAIKEEHPSPCTMELNVNRYNKALGFYEHMGMHKVREVDEPIGDGFYMNDYIMGMEI